MTAIRLYSGQGPRAGSQPRQALAFLPVVVLLVGVVGCWTRDHWGGADTFVSKLRCGMSHAEVQQVAALFPGLSVKVPESKIDDWNLLAAKDSTLIYLSLDADQLRKFQIRWVDSVMHMAKHSEVQLCEPPGGTLQ
jgi:hypothetical protein